jgi:hypothetical protein
MARQPYFVNTSQKQMEVYSSFGGGMVTQYHPEKLKDDQAVLLENCDIVQGGVVQSRGAYAEVSSCPMISYNRMEELIDEEITFDMLKTHTFDSIKNEGFLVPNGDKAETFQTFDEMKLQSFTVNDLKNYTFDQLLVGIPNNNSGDSQGAFRYYKVDGYTDILAINGKLYTIVDKNTYRKLVINGMKNFQTARTIEAVQYRDKMYFATGSGLVVYDGTNASLVSAYVPTGLEVLYVGTNGYAADPDNYMSNAIGAANVLLGVTTNLRYGVINEPVVFTAYVEKIETDTLEYKFETKTVDDTAYTVAQDWSINPSMTAIFSTSSDYMIKVSLRVFGTTVVLSQYIIPKYKVNATYSEKIEPSVDFTDLSTCNRIFIHYDRLWIYGDTGNPDYLYVSHLSKFNYFPRTNILMITDPLRGKLKSVKQYKNFLVSFTNGSIQMITGKNPLEFVVQPIHTTLGTKYDYSVQVMKNYIVFVGTDGGVYILKSFNYASDDKLNVERIDDSVRDSLTSLIEKSTRILSCVYNNQYFLYIESEKIHYVYRYYYELGVWVRDVVPYGFLTMENVGNAVTATSVLGATVYNLKSDAYRDGTDEVFTMRIISKNFNFNIPHHRKKLKQYQIITDLTEVSVINVDIYVDDSLLSSESLIYDDNQSSSSQKLTLMSSGRFRHIRTDINIPVHETVQIIGFSFVFKQNTPK